jgi:hypothetical protein
LNDEKLAACLVDASPGEASSLRWFLQADAVAFFGLAELLTDVLDSVEARLEAMRRGLV